MSQASLRSFADSELTSRVIVAASDLAFLVDRDGVILDLSLGESIAANEGWNKLIGRRWSETVAKESQGKVEQLLTAARQSRSLPRAREINQRAEGVGEVPVRFNAVPLDDEQQRVVAIGRDLRPIATLQQQMVAAQQAMDVEYGRMRQADTRYRVLFHVSAEGAVVADVASRRILEANPAAASLVGDTAQSLVGKTVSELFAPESKPILQALIAGVEGGGRPSDVNLKLSGASETTGIVVAAVSMFRQSGSTSLLLRFWPASGGTMSSGARAHRMIAMVEAIPDGFVVTDDNQQILCANSAFCELVQQANENQVLGEKLDRWLGRPGVDVDIMLAGLRERGVVRNFATIVRGEFGDPHEALVTAVSALDGKVPCLGFTIRRVSARQPAPTSKTSVMPRSIEQLRELVGRVPLKELVRESADLIERLCIEAALDVSGNNRASAAQLLGLSRQGLYSKLRRYGLEEFDPT